MISWFLICLSSHIVVAKYILCSIRHTICRPIGTYLYTPQDLFTHETCSFTVYFNNTLRQMLINSGVFFL